MSKRRFTLSREESFFQGQNDSVFFLLTDMDSKHITPIFFMNIGEGTRALQIGHETIVHAGTSEYPAGQLSNALCYFSGQMEELLAVSFVADITEEEGNLLVETTRCDEDTLLLITACVARHEARLLGRATGRNDVGSL